MKKLNADCNLNAGLEAILQIAGGGHVMLRRNIDRYHWLVRPNKNIFRISCVLSPDLPLVSVMMISAVVEPRLTPVLVVERTIYLHPLLCYQQFVHTVNPGTIRELNHSTNISVVITIWEQEGEGEGERQRQRQRQREMEERVRERERDREGEKEGDKESQRKM